jgi:sodium/hydrogen exchanger 3
VVLIPPIIFEAGYHLETSFFFTNIVVILSYAVIGTILNNVIVAALLFAIGASHIYLNPLSFTDALVFGAILAAVDPVAVLAVFEQVHVNEELNILVFGESVLNDAVCIVLYNLFLSLRVSVFTAAVPFLAIAKFLVVSLLGVVIGTGMALLCAFVTKFTRKFAVAQPVVIGVCALLSFDCAQMVGASGITAILFCGIVMTRYCDENLQQTSRVTIDVLLKVTASTAEGLVFVYLGATSINQFVFVAIQTHDNWDWVLIVITLVLILAARFAVTYFLTYLANRSRVRPISRRNEFVLAFSGLRGSVAFALSFLLPLDFVGRNALITTSLVIIWFSVFVLGAIVKPIIKW